MDEQMELTILHYAAMCLEWLDIDARQHCVPRQPLVGLFIDTLQALEQAKEQEE